MYTEDEVELWRKHYRKNDPTHWPYFVIEMPLGEDGQGPETEPGKMYKITYEVWDIFCNSYESFENLPKAIQKAMDMNDDLFG